MVNYHIFMYCLFYSFIQKIAYKPMFLYSQSCQSSCNLVINKSLLLWSRRFKSPHLNINEWEMDDFMIPDLSALIHQEVQIGQQLAQLGKSCLSGKLILVSARIVVPPINASYFSILNFCSKIPQIPSSYPLVPS